MKRMSKSALYLLILLSIGAYCIEKDPVKLVYGAGSCNTALGMESGQISDGALTASSAFDVKSVGAINSRIRQDLRGGAWCPKNLVSSNTREFLQIDLGADFIITAIESQGRFGSGRGQEFAQKLFIEYWRKGVSDWIVYRDYNGSKLLEGNTNTYTPILNRLQLPFTASILRIFPYAEHPRTACLRVEIYGCPAVQNLRQYSAPPGGFMKYVGDVLVNDASYDGHLVEDYMRGGLGQLTDSIMGEYEVELPYEGETNGSKWVGWSQRKLQNEPVELQFDFWDLRNFTSVHVHTSNAYNRDIRLFLLIEVHFSIDGVRWQLSQEVLKPKRSSMTEDPKIVAVNLHGRTAQSIKLRLHFNELWLLVSEVYFVSEPAGFNVTDAFADAYYKVPASNNTNYSDEEGGTSFMDKVPVWILVGVFVALVVLGSIGVIAYSHRGKLTLSAPAVPPRRPIGYREPYSLTGEQFPGKATEEQPEYNEILECRYLKCPVKPEVFYASTEILQPPYEPEVKLMKSNRGVFSGAYIENGQFTCIRLPRADPPASITTLLAFPRRKLRLLENLGHTPFGYLQTCEGEGIEHVEDVRYHHQHHRSTRRKKMPRMMLVKTLNDDYTPYMNFYDDYGFPGIVGAIDCTHVAIVPPSVEDNEVIYVNRKNYHSLNTQLVLTAIRLLSVGSYQRAVGQEYHLVLGQTTVSKVLKLFLTKFLAKFYEKYIVFPTSAGSRKAVVDGFYNKYRFPNVLGCIDCTHVAIATPHENPESFKCHHDFYSLNVQLICDVNGKILNVNARYPGRTHDQFIFNNSSVKEEMIRLYENRIGDYHLIGNSGYALEPWMMTPIVPTLQGTAEERYTQLLCQLRNVIERVNGILKAIFRSIKRERVLHYQPIVANKIVNACCTLYNMMLTYRVPLPEPDLNAVDLVNNYQQENGRLLNIARNKRDRLIQEMFAL